MEDYIEDLILRLGEMTENPTPAPDYANLNPNHPASNVEGLEMITGMDTAPEMSPSKLFGLPVETFPPSDMLTQEQQQQILQAIETLLLAYHIHIDYPSQDMPIRSRYNKVREFWERESVQHLNIGHFHFDGCTGSPEGCFWEEHCYCAKIV